jgi:hypothetical protein
VLPIVAFWLAMHSTGRRLEPSCAPRRVLKPGTGFVGGRAKDALGVAGAMTVRAARLDGEAGRRKGGMCALTGAGAMVFVFW